VSRKTVTEWSATKNEEHNDWTPFHLIHPPGNASMMHSYAHASFLWPRPIALAAVVTGNVVIAAADDAAAHD
jgi:hypothetical protein